MTVATISFKIHYGAEEKLSFYIRNTQEVIKRKLALANQHEIIFRPLITRGEDTDTIGARLCFHPKHSRYAREIYECLKREVLRSAEKAVYFGVRDSVTKIQVLWVWFTFTVMKLQRRGNQTP